MRTVKEQETLLDIAILTTGNADDMLKLAMKNNVDIDDVVGGQLLEDVESSDIDIVNELKARDARPASAILTDVFADEWEQYYNEGLPESHE